nr:hypothetical protein [Tanacetum cinerariifolium]
EITATIDGKVKVVTEASVRRHLKLDDFDGPIFQGEGSTVPVESHHTPTSALSTLQPHLLPTPRSSIRQETKVPQPSSPPYTSVADEATSTGVDVKHGGAATTAKKVYDAAYTKLIMKLKKLERTVKTSKARKIEKIIVFDNKEDLEDPSKQGRKIDEINQDPNMSLIQHDAETQG